MTPQTPDRVDVLGTGLSLTSYEHLLELLDHPPTGPRARAVAFCNVHSVMVARTDPELGRALAGMDVATTDGVPLVWAVRRMGHPAQQRVYGPDLMEAALPRSVARGWRHYFYGSSPSTLDALVARARAMAPGIEVVGAVSPPFRALSAAEEEAELEAIRVSGATHVWVGLGMPKQELFVHRVADRLPGVSLLAVGAAFDFLAGTVPQAPDRLQQIGLEWLYRLCREPRRLWRRYAVHNPRFVVLIAAQLWRRRGR